MIFFIFNAPFVRLITEIGPNWWEEDDKTSIMLSAADKNDRALIYKL